MTVSTRTARLAVLLLVAALGLAGCGYKSVQDVPLPGGASLGDEPYSVTVLLSNVVDLVANNSVRVNDVPVGVVRDISLAPDGWTAQATVEVNGAIMLPANAIARVRQTSLLGEKFIDLSPPTDAPPQGRLANGAVIGLDRTDVGAQVEEVLGALSLLLNGGGVEKVQSIAREINAGAAGNEPELRSLIDNVNVFVGTLDGQRDSIVRALDSLDRLTRTLVDQRARLANVIDILGPGLDVLNQERGDLVAMLQALQRLSGVATDVINRSQDDFVADLRALQPTLGKLVEAGDNLPGALQILVTIPFADNALNAVKGDYANITLTADLNIQDLINNILLASAPGSDQIFAPLAPVVDQSGTATARSGGTATPDDTSSGASGTGTLGKVLNNGALRLPAQGATR